MYWKAFLAQLTQSMISLDQFFCTLAGWLSLLWAVITRDDPPSTHMADETISAMLYRKHRDGKFWGRLLMKPVDLLFSLWQRDDLGQRIKDHCFRAYIKEQAKANLPREYADTHVK